jgi:hypothetical protein
MSPAIGGDQLAVLLQASLDRAKELLEVAGSFLPFASRADLTGAIEFLEIENGGGGETLDALYRHLGAVLAEDALRGGILAASLVANTGLPADVDGGFDTAVSVFVEARDFCRSIVAPYRFAGGAIEFGRMIPEEADPVIFAPSS